MKFYKKQAFSLTELLIVLVVVAVLFAALAPIMTKRRNGANTSNETVWNYVNDDDQMDSFYDPGIPSWTSTAFVGYKPGNIQSPYAKLVIKAGLTKGGNLLPQRHIQFRFGNGDGANAGTLFLNDKNNVLISSDNEGFITADTAKGTTIAGMGAFQNRKTGDYSVAYGFSSMRGPDNVSTSPGPGFTAVGTNTGKNIDPRTSNSNTITQGVFVGSNSGLTKNIPIYSTALGAYSMASENYYGNKNVYAGYNTGGGSSKIATSYDQHNVMVSSTFSGATNSGAYPIPAYNTILGYGTYPTGLNNVRLMTAVGYNACASIGSESGSKTCIGVGSGSSQNNTPEGFRSDSYERIFIGGLPKGGFRGRSVLEVHNLDGYYKPLLGEQQRAPYNFGKQSVVFNSNIVVRGNFYTTTRTGKLASHKFKGISAAWTNKFQCHGDFYLFRRYRCSWWGSPGDKSKNFMDFAGGECGVNGSSYSFNSMCPNLKTSDLRLKENIEDNHDSIRELLSVNPYNYEFKADKKHTPQTGVIAQDLQKVFPASVTKGNDGYLRIRWDEMFYAAINAIKSLDKKVEKLASDISSMESDVKNLKSNHKVLQKRIASLNARATKIERK